MGDGLGVVAVGGHVERDAVEPEGEQLLDLLADGVGVADDEPGADASARVASSSVSQSQAAVAQELVALASASSIVRPSTASRAASC